MRAFFLALLVTGCGGSVTETPASLDGGTDTATDTASAETGGCSSTAPTTMCFFGGGAGRACADVAQSMVCSGGKWACPSGTNTECGCMAGSSGGGLPLKPGDMCPDADAGAPCCLGSTVAWYPDGGRVAYVDKSSIAPCKTYEHHRETSGPGPMGAKCTNELLACGAGDAIDTGDVRAALNHADVTAALAAAPVVYGKDPRPYDGQVFRITIGEKVIDVGDECGDTVGCKAIPAGVKALATMLKAVDTAQLAKAPCAGTF
jgi:hypothetical protein